MTLPTTGAPELALSQAIPETTVNEMGRRLDANIWGAVIEDRDLTAPPGSSSDGGSYLVAASPTGAWTGKAGQMATSVGVNAASGWYFTVVAKEGLHLYVKDENIALLYNGAAWVEDSDALSGLTDVDITGLADSDVLAWDAGASEWVPVPLPGGGGGGGTVPNGGDDGQALVKQSGVDQDADWEYAGPVLLIDQAGNGTVGTYTFSSLSGVFNNLVLEITARSDNASAGTNCFIRLNGDTGANYDTVTHRADNATASSAPSAGQTSMFVGEIPAATAIAGEAGNIIITIPLYAATTFRKDALIRSGRKTSDAVAGLRSDTIYGCWRNTAAITSVTVLITAGNFITGSRIRGYGTP